MTTPKYIPAEFSVGRDLLGYTLAATPAPDIWLATFAASLVQQPTIAHGTDALMSGLRFYTAAFVAEIVALPPVEARLPPLPNSTVRAIYTATGPLIVTIYQTLIRRQAGRADLQAAFAQAAGALLASYLPDANSTNRVNE